MAKPASPSTSPCSPRRLFSRPSFLPSVLPASVFPAFRLSRLSSFPPLVIPAFGRGTIHRALFPCLGARPPAACFPAFHLSRLSFFPPFVGARYIVPSFHAPAPALPPHVIPSELGRRFFSHHHFCDDVDPRSEESLLFLVFFATRHPPLATSSLKKLCHPKQSEQSAFSSAPFNFQPLTLSHRHPPTDKFELSRLRPPQHISRVPKTASPVRPPSPSSPIEIWCSDSVPIPAILDPRNGNPPVLICFLRFAARGKFRRQPRRFSSCRLRPAAKRREASIPDRRT